MTFHFVASITLDHVITTMTLDTVVAFVASIAFFVAPLESLPVLWHKEYVVYFKLLQKVHHSNLDGVS
jgi:hypothetical protein